MPTQGEFHTSTRKAAGKMDFKMVYSSHQTPNAFLSLINS